MILSLQWWSHWSWASIQLTMVCTEFHLQSFSNSPPKSNDDNFNRYFFSQINRPWLKLRCSRDTYELILLLASTCCLKDSQIFTFVCLWFSEFSCWPPCRFFSSSFQIFSPRVTDQHAPMQHCHRGTFLLHNHVAQGFGIMLSWLNSNAYKHLWSNLVIAAAYPFATLLLSHFNELTIRVFVTEFFLIKG